MMGKMPKILKTKSSKQPQLKWKTRKENQIKRIRAELSILTDMVQKGETQKISKKKHRIKSKYKITTNQELQTVTGYLKMKIQAKAQRIWRHVKRSKQFSQNQMFANNKKKFVRNLGKEQMSVEKPLKKEATETCWCFILENNGVQPFSRVDKEREAETEYQPWEDISLDELQTAIKKTSNWKSSGPDVVPNVSPKQLTARHQHLLNAYNQAIENPEICLTGSQQQKHT